MKKLLLLFFLIYHATTFSQTLTIELYEFGNDTLNLIRFKTSHGIGHLFVTMYEHNEQTKDLVKNAVKRIQNNETIHCLYLFVPLKEGLSKEYKEKLFAGIVKQAIIRENLKNIVRLYVNFDQDYSKIYKEDQAKGMALPQIRRIKVVINSKKLRGLFRT